MQTRLQTSGNAYTRSLAKALFNNTKGESLEQIIEEGAKQTVKNMDRDADWQERQDWTMQPEAQKYKSTTYVPANKTDQRTYQHERKLTRHFDFDHYQLDKKENDEWKEIYDQPYKYAVTNDTITWMKQFASKENDSSDEEIIYNIMKDNLEYDRLLSLGINLENTLEDNVSEFRT